MKIKNTMVALTLLATQGALSQGNISASDNPSQMIATAVTLNILTFAGLNDVLMVQDEAVIAMETGEISEDLESVMEKLRASDISFAKLSDENLIKEILKLKDNN